MGKCCRCSLHPLKCPALHLMLPGAQRMLNSTTWVWGWVKQKATNTSLPNLTTVTSKWTQRGLWERRQYLVLAAAHDAHFGREVHAPNWVSGVWIQALYSNFAYFGDCAIPGHSPQHTEWTLRKSFKPQTSLATVSPKTKKSESPSSSLSC